jgi:hypothetical protein
MRFYKLSDTSKLIPFSNNFFDALKNVVLLVYLFLIVIMIGVIVIEVKHMYNIDIFPGIDTPFDNVYYQSLPSSN